MCIFARRPRETIFRRSFRSCIMFEEARSELSPGHRVYLVIPADGYIPRTSAQDLLSDLPPPLLSRPVGVSSVVPLRTCIFLRKRGTFASGCGTAAINLSRHAIIFVPGAGIYQGRSHRCENICTRTRTCVCVCVSV